MEEELNETPYTFLKLPLFQNPDYYYTTPLEGVAYKIRLYYNVKLESWMMDVRYADNTPIILVVKVIPNYPILVDHEMPFSGFFVFESIGKDQNETVNNPFELWKYYNLFYGYVDTTTVEE